MKFEIYIFETKKTPSFYRKAIAEYEKRLGRYCKISCRFIKKEREWAKAVESSDGGIFVLPGENSPTSEEFAAQIERWENTGKSRLSFFVPGENPEIKNSSPAFCQLSLSDFSMNSAMSAMVLYEQIYRGYRILNHHPYHK